MAGGISASIAQQVGPVNATAVAEFIRPPFGIGCSGSGFAIMYFVGLLRVLQYMDIILPGKSIIGASSAGILTALPLMNIMTMDELEDVVKNTAATCRKRQGCFGALQPIVKDQLRKLLKPGSYQRVQGGKFFMTLSFPVNETVPVKDMLWKARLFPADDFKSDEDLLEGISGATYMPYWHGPNFTIPFRNTPVYDGGFEYFMPCPPTSVVPDDRCLKLSAWPGGVTTKEATASVRLVTDNPLMRGINFTQALVSYQGSNPPFRGIQQLADIIMKDFPMPSNFDIYPGKWGPMFCSRAEYLALSLIPGDPKVLQQQHDMGVRDAIAWANARGLLLT
eukprot:jgi/Chrzof1/13016/Cz07g16160.t1